MTTSAKLIAFYLPQFHPTPENDSWWGKGFTEWTNVAKAKPLFKGHYQPRFPADLGYYDLRVPEVREEQAHLAKEYGIYGFCYYHYWFGEGKRVLDRPLQEVLRLKKPDMPFCLCWANETWKGVWFGKKGNTLMEQKYPGKDDYRKHFNYLLPAFSDDRYIKIDGKALFNVYMPGSIPDLNEFTDCFREMAHKAGLNGLYLVASRVEESWNPVSNGFDGVIGSEFSRMRYVDAPNASKSGIIKRIDNWISKYIPGFKQLDLEIRKKPIVVEYENAIKHLISGTNYEYDYFPCVVPDWDNSPRTGMSSLILKNSTPGLWEKHLKEGIKKVSAYPDDKKIVFVKSWNEWAESNYLEPDAKWGHSYLEVVKRVLTDGEYFR